MKQSNELSILDGFQVLKDAHNEADHAIDVVNVSSLVPHQFGKVEFTYNADKNVSIARYYSVGQVKESRVITRSDHLGSAEMTKVNFYDTTASTLEGKYIIMYDNVGTVAVWFDMDNGSTPPVTGALRDIEVDIAFNDSPSMLAAKFQTIVDADAQFICVVGGSLAIVSSISIGNKTDSFDGGGTGLEIIPIDGTSPNTLNSKYFYVYAGNDAVAFYVYYSVGGAGVDPAIIGKTAIMVPLTAGATDIAVATATVTALNATNYFNATNDGATISIKALYPGPASDTVDVDTSFAIRQYEDGIARTLLQTLILTYNADKDIISTEAI